MGTRIIPYSLPNEGSVGIQKMTVTYTQRGDSNQQTGDIEDQFLTVETEDTIVTEQEALQGEGYYFVIKTDRWAFDSPEQMNDILSDFRKRLLVCMDGNDTE